MFFHLHPLIIPETLMSCECKYKMLSKLILRIEVLVLGCCFFCGVFVGVVCCCFGWGFVGGGGGLVFFPTWLNQQQWRN